MKTLQDVIKKINALKAELQSLPPISEKDKQRLWQKFRLEWNYNSNHIEGNTLTYGETKLLLLFDKTPEETHEMRELEEMKAHDVAIEIIREWAESNDRPLAEANIRELNSIILVRPFWKDAITKVGNLSTRKKIVPGEYKSNPNHVQLPNGETFYYAEPEEVIPKMQELMAWYRNEADGVHPLEVAAKLHYRLVLIHPFDDGNGRVSRLLMNYHLLRYAYPPVIIKTADKKAYLNALNKADSGNLEAFIQYIGEQLIWSLELNIKAAKGESVEEEEDWKKELAVLEKTFPKDESVKEMNNEILFQRYKDSIQPLFDSLEQELQSFNRFFEISEIKRNYTARQSHQEPQEPDFDKKMAFFYEKNWLEHLRDVSLNFRWNGFKKGGTNVFPMSFWVTVSFEQFKYIIKSNYGQPQQIESLYAHTLTETQIKDFVRTSGEILVESLKNQIKRNGK